MICQELRFDSRSFRYFRRDQGREYFIVKSWCCVPSRPSISLGGFWGGEWRGGLSRIRSNYGFFEKHTPQLSMYQVLAGNIFFTDCYRIRFFYSLQYQLAAVVLHLRRKICSLVVKRAVSSAAKDFVILQFRIQIYLMTIILVNVWRGQ